jgi:hypothetical protein
MIKGLYFIFCLSPYLTKHSLRWLSLFLHLDVNNSHLDYKQKFPKKTLLRSQNIEGWLNIFTSSLVYSKIWQNHHQDEPLFLHILMNDSHFDYEQKFLKKPVMCSQNIEWLLKFCTSYLFIARFWLNLPEDDRQIFSTSSYKW